MQATVVFVVGLGESRGHAAAPGGRRRRGRQARLSEPGATAPIVPPATSLRNEVARPAARGVPRRGRAGRGRRRGRPHLVRVDRQLPAGRPGAAAGRAHLGRDRRRTCASWPRAARACTARATRRSRPSTCSGRRHDRSRSSAGPQYGEKPDYAGLLTFAGAPYTQDPAELEGFDVAIVGAPMDDLVSDRPGARFAPRAIRAASCPPGPHLEVEDRRLRRAAGGRLRRRAGHPGRPRALARRDRGDRRARCSAPARCRSSLGRRPLDHRAVACAPARPSTARSASCTSTPTPTPATRSSASTLSHGTFMKRLIDDGHVDRRRYAQIGLRGYWPGETEFGWQAERGVTSLFAHDVRDLGIREVVTPRGGRRRRRPGVPDRRRRRPRPGLPRRRDRHARARRA